MTTRVRAARASSSAEKQKWSSHALSPYGLAEFIANARSKTPKNGSLNLSYWPVTDDDLSVVATAGLGANTLSLRHCTKITDNGMLQLSAMQQGVIGGGLLSLDLAGCILLTDKACQMIAEFLPRLQTVDLSGCCQISDEGICAVLRGCKHLQSISLQSLSGLSNPTIDAIRTNVIMFKRLHFIDLCNCTNFADEALIKLLEDDCSGCIQTLNLSDCKQLKIGLTGFRRKGKISTNCRSLKLCRTLSTTDSTMSWLAEGCRNLQSLDLSDCDFPESALTYLFRGCTRLRTLNLSGCNCVADVTLYPLTPEAGTRLTELNLAGCSNVTDKGIGSVAAACPHLEIINLSGVPLVTCKGLTAIAKNCHLLKSVNISSDITALNVDPKSRVPRVGPEGISALGRHCKFLAILQCNGASRIDDTAIVKIATGCSRLEVLSLRHCHHITDKSIEAVGKHCHFLRYLDLGCCLKLTDTGILSLSQGCRNLESIDFTGLGNLTDNSMVPLATQCTALRNFIVRDCHRLSDRVVSALCAPDGRRPSVLEKIDCFAIDDISDAALSYLRKCRTTLKYADFVESRVSSSGIKAFSNQMPHCAQSKSARFRPRHKEATYLQYREYISFVGRYYDKVGSIILGPFDRQKIYTHKAKVVWGCCQLQRIIRGFIARALSEELRILAQEARARSSSCDVRDIAADDDTAIATDTDKVKRRKSTPGMMFQAHAEGEPVEIDNASVETVAKCKILPTTHPLSKPRSDTDPKNGHRTGVTTSVDSSAVFAELHCSWLSYKWRCFVTQLVKLQAEKDRRRADAQRHIRRWWKMMKSALDSRHQNVAAVCLQEAASLYISKKRAAQQQKFAEMEFGARILQASWRSRLRWNALLEKILVQEASFRALHSQQCRSALLIQKKWRSFRKAVQILEEAATARELSRLQLNAATQMQASWRGYRATKIRNENLKIIQHWKILVRSKILLHRNFAAKRIQSRWRHRLWHMHRIEAAQRLQSLFRRRQSYLISLYLKYARREKAVFLIQRAYRGYRNRCVLLRTWLLYGKHILIIQRSYRSYMRRRAWQSVVRETRIRSRAEQNEMKRRLILKKHERKILRLLCKRDAFAATKIQQAFRTYSMHKGAAEERCRLEAEAAYVEAAIQEKYEHSEARKTSRTKMDYLIQTPSWCRSSGGRLSAALPTKSRRTRNKAVHKSSISTPADAKVSAGKENHELNVVHLIEELKHCDWYDKRLELCLSTYGLKVDDVFQLYEAFQDIDCSYGQDGQVYIDYIFDYIRAPLSGYGQWLFIGALHDDDDDDDDEVGVERSLAGAKPKTKCTFSVFVHAVCCICTMGKSAQAQFLFSSRAETRYIGKEYAKIMTEQQWEDLIRVMVLHEEIRYPIQPAARKFRQFSHSNPSDPDERVLFFDGFIQLLATCPFLVFPLARLQQKFQKAFLGEQFWNRKSKKLVTASS